MKKALMLVWLFALCNLTLLAQIGQNPRVVHTKEKSAIHVPPQEASEGLKRIYSNLGKSKTELYYDSVGWSISGPNSEDSVTSFIGIPFTPKSDSHVSQVRVAVQYGGRGANQVDLSIYGDAGGVPGVLLAGPVTVTNLPDFGTCCTLAVANFSAVAVTGGARYWIVANTPLTGTGSDFVGAWDYVPPTIPQGFYNGSAWIGIDGLSEAVGEVLGSIP